MTRVVALLSALFVLFVARQATAHKPSDSYLTLAVDGTRVHARWDVAVRDLDYAIGVDADGSGTVTWGELRARAPAITTYVIDRVSIRTAGSACTLQATTGETAALATHSDGAYAVIRFDAECAEPVRALDVHYRLFFDVDPLHRGIVRIEGMGAPYAHALSASSSVLHHEGTREPFTRRLGSMVRTGIVHIWQGYDHVFFLLALLLPSVLRRERGQWVPVPRLRPALLDVLRVVTSFTVAHSITLTIAVLGIVTLPSRVVESAIAVSVVLAAANNLVPILGKDRWMAAFVLGLMHGFGFSSTLDDLGLARSDLLAPLFGFNAGVEIGQLAIVSVFVPIAYAVRRFSSYRRLVLVGASVVIAVLGTVWLLERAFLVRIIS